MEDKRVEPDRGSPLNPINFFIYFLFLYCFFYYTGSGGNGFGKI